jgi:hypothetical protein
MAILDVITFVFYVAGIVAMGGLVTRIISNSIFTGYRYTPEMAGNDHKGVILGNKKGKNLQMTLPDFTWEFWVEQ